MIEIDDAIEDSTSHVNDMISIAFTGVSSTMYDMSGRTATFVDGDAGSGSRSSLIWRSNSVGRVRD